MIRDVRWTESSAPTSRAVMIVALIWTTIMAVRLHELFPQLAVLRPALLTFAVGCIVLAVKLSARTMRASLRHSISKWVLAYVGWAALSVATALWGGGAFDAWTGLVLASSVYFAYVVVEPTNATYEYLSRWLVLLTCLNAVGLLVLGDYAGGRLSSTGAYDANDLAALTVIALPFAIIFFLRAKSLTHRWIGVSATAILLGTLIKTGSRGGILALAASVTVFVFGFRGARRMKLLAAAAVAALIGWQAAGAQFQQRMRSLTNLEQDYNVQSEVGRKQVWLRGIGYALGRPITGVGIGNFPVAEGGTLSSEGRTGKWSAAHSSYVQAFAELGFPGGFIFLGLLFALGRRALRVWRKDRRTGVHRPELLAGLVSFLVASAFLSHAYFSTLFMLAGLIVIAEKAALTGGRRPPAELLMSRGRRQRAPGSPRRVGPPPVGVTPSR